MRPANQSQSHAERLHSPREPFTGSLMHIGPDPILIVSSASPGHLRVLRKGARMLSNSWSLYHKTFAIKDQSRVRFIAQNQEYSRTEHIVQEPEHRASDKMGHHKSRRPTSSDSGYDTTSERSYSPPSSPSSVPASAKVGFAKQRSLDYDVTSLFTSATRTDLTAAIGTQLSDIQISSLNVHQLRELAILASERGVVFFRDQDLTAQDQLRIFDHFGSFHGKQITERDAHSLKIKSSPTDHGERFTLSGRQNHWVSEQSFEVRPPSYTLLKAEEAGGDTVWVSSSQS